MRVNRIIFAGMAIVSAALQAVAQPNSGNLPVLEKADTIIGKAVHDAHNRDAGKIVDLAVDWQGGRVAAVLIETSGRIIAVPPEAIAPTLSKEYRLKGNLDTFKGSVGFDPVRLGPLVQANKILRQTVRNERNQRLAKVVNFMVEFPSGRIPRVILASIGFLGLRGQLTAVQPEAFYFEPDFCALVLNTTRAELKHAQHFKAEEWRNAASQSFDIAAADDSLKMLHAWTADGMVQPMGIVRDDAAITAEITKTILDTAGLSSDARHVVITTRDGQVTLHGEVDNERERQQLGEVAANVAGVDHVENKIEVKLFALSDE